MSDDTTLSQAWQAVPGFRWVPGMRVYSTASGWGRLGKVTLHDGARAVLSDWRKEPDNPEAHEVTFLTGMGGSLHYGAYNLWVPVPRETKV